MKSAGKRVLAIDPGYDRVGVAVMEKGSLLFSECFIPPKGDFDERLRDVYRHVSGLVREYSPDALALETLYFSTNQKTAIHVAEARGVIILAGAEAGVPLFEYSPQAVKIAVTGSGNAAKSGVMKMVPLLIALPAGKRHDDEFDAIALAIAHLAVAH